MTTLFISHSTADKDWALDLHAILQGHGYHSLFLDSHPDDGIPVGAEWERELWRKLRQSSGIVVLCTEHWLASPWCISEAMIARERGKSIFLLATVDDSKIPQFLKDHQILRFAGQARAESYDLLRRGLRQSGIANEFKLPDQPYPGLNAFQEKDAAIFFGRDTEIDSVIDTLVRCRRGNGPGFILILGASGCGKSSLARAGVVPRLKSNAAASGWLIAPAFFASKGNDGLAFSLSTAFAEVALLDDLNILREGSATTKTLRSLAEKVIQARRMTDGCLLIILDQLEEVFELLEDSPQRSMLKLLLEASAEPRSPIMVLATMRSDFLNDFQLFEGSATQYTALTLDPMTRNRFSEVIEKPADRFGLRLEAGLTNRLVEETGYSDALPLLAFTLEKLYARCKSGEILTIQAYEDIGGVPAAIKYAAEAILKEAGYAPRSIADQRMCDLRSAFYSLVRIGEVGQFTRRTSTWSQLPTSTINVMEQFVRQRLMISGSTGSERTLTVSHEALFRSWDTLQSWLEEDRRALILRAQIEDAAEEWTNGERIASLSWPDDRILDAVRIIDHSGVSLNDVTRPETVHAFLGPTGQTELQQLLALAEDMDATSGSGKYGDGWRLPLTHAARASVGARLALLGDTRRGVGVGRDGLPDIEWVKIDSSEVTVDIRADPNDVKSEVIERLKRRVEGFSIARYPVTIAQFRAFCQACQQNTSIKAQQDIALNLSPGHLAGKYDRIELNKAASNISWYEAEAFCKWLSQKSSLFVRLPNEFEWQLAATGGNPSNSYPWGPGWKPEMANTSESGLGKVTAVGMYPGGVSTQGIFDFAGTTWEWCVNSFERPDDNSFPSGGSDLRVMRGGSWYSDLKSASCADRYRISPFDKYSDIGFRVVCDFP